MNTPETVGVTQHTEAISPWATLSVAAGLIVVAYLITKMMVNRDTDNFRRQDQGRKSIYNNRD